MNLWRWISQVTARLADKREQAPAPAATPISMIAAAPPPAHPRGVGRPVSTSLARTIDMASANPAITPAEVAAAVGVSRDYARTLLRRARKRATGVECVTQPTVRNATRVAQPAPVLSAINLTPRARALHFLAEGDTPQQAAAKLGVPVGEVEFISKVDRLLNPAT